MVVLCSLYLESLESRLVVHSASLAPLVVARMLWRQ